MGRFAPHLRVALLKILLAALLLASVSPIASASAVSARCGSWRWVHGPAGGGQLYGVAAISQSDIWAVGIGYYPNDGSYPLNDGIAEHWDGTRWSLIVSPQPGKYNNYLYGVAALTSRDVWAVGAYESFNGPNLGKQKTLIEHWDGTRWSMIASPNPGAYTNGLQGATAFSPSDVWAVGNDANGKGGARTLTENWNGKQWSVVNSPSIGGFDNELRSVAGVSPQDMWAVGLNWEAPGDIVVTLTEHWNGSVWSAVASPNSSGNLNGLSGVTAPTTSDVWAVGFGGGVSGALIEHWTGKQWSIVASPGSSTWSLGSITALNPHDIWAVGSKNSSSLLMRYC